MFEDLKQADWRPLLKLELKSGYFSSPRLVYIFSKQPKMTEDLSPCLNAQRIS